MDKLLTIVVPVYKVEPYINKCLDSCILADKKLMSQLEVIIVNDGTPDNSAEMAREYVKRYPQTFRQIDKENGGHGSACNVGLKEATGKYVRFLDSDDWLTNLDKLVNTLSHTNVDLVFTHAMHWYADVKTEMHKIIGTQNQECVIDKFPFEDNTIWVTGLGVCTYKTSILQKYHPLFLEKYPYDDTILFVSPLILAKSFLITEYYLYNYLIGRPGQSTEANLMRRQFIALWKTHQYCSLFFDKYSSLCDSENAKKSIDRYFSERAQVILSLPLIELPFEECKAAYTLCFRQIKDPTGNVYRRFVKYPFGLFWILEKIRNTDIYRKIKQ